jgi:hypothetical protein
MARWICLSLILGSSLVGLGTLGCGSDDGDSTKQAFASIKNDFNNPSMAYQPPWTICQSSYLGVEFGPIGTGATSAEKPVAPGLDNVLMVAAWNDPTCAPATCLPLASKHEEEIVDGQHRSIAINMANHQGPCPPEGTAPIPQALYDRILALWPSYGFLPYAERTSNPQCATK